MWTSATYYKHVYIIVYTVAHTLRNALHIVCMYLAFGHPLTAWHIQSHITISLWSFMLSNVLHANHNQHPYYLMLCASRFATRYSQNNHMCARWVVSIHISWTCASMWHYMYNIDYYLEALNCDIANCSIAILACRPAAVTRSHKVYTHMYSYTWTSTAYYTHAHVSLYTVAHTLRHSLHIVCMHLAFDHQLTSWHIQSHITISLWLFMLSDALHRNHNRMLHSDCHLLAIETIVFTLSLHWI